MDQTHYPFREFALLIGNPLIKVAVYEAPNEEYAWESARQEWGSHVGWSDARLYEVLS